MSEMTRLASRLFPEDLPRFRRWLGLLGTATMLIGGALVIVSPPEFLIVAAAGHSIASLARWA